ncbi:MAG: DNA mismatch repair protein MutS [Pseudomonadota bacterium]
MTVNAEDAPAHPLHKDAPGHGKSGTARKTHAARRTDAPTPMMAQYLEIKTANPDSLLFYRMGDFYELFFDDAVVASEALGITLTKRGKHAGADIPMAGVPVHAADDYLQRLIRAGFRVAVCEQTEDPAEAKKRGAKSVVRRDVTRLVTPGTLTEDTLLQAGSANYLTALFPLPRDESDAGRRIASASLDISTGAFVIGEIALADLAGELTRLLPREVLLPDSDTGDAALLAAVELVGAVVAPLPTAHFRSSSGARDMKAALGVADIAAFGAFTRGELAAVAGLLKYIDLTQIGAKPIVRPPTRCGTDHVMVIDGATRANLELIRTTSGARKNSLLETMDRTVTGPGARELAARLSSPLTDPHEINARLDVVSYLLQARVLRDNLRATLRTAPDMARAISRLALQRGTPRDLGSVRDALTAAATCGAALINPSANQLTAPELPRLLKALAARLLSDLGTLSDALATALEDELPPHGREGGFIRAGYSSDLDENRKLRDESRSVLVDMQVRYQTMTGVKGLKVKHNNLLGYFVEVSSANADVLRAAPHDALFSQRQSMANAVRFMTPELSDIEGRITAAGERALAIEQRIFSTLSADVHACRDALSDVADALAELDCVSALALLADEEGHTRPLVDDSRTFMLDGAQHPVVARALRQAGDGPFIANDCHLAPAPEADGAIAKVQARAEAPSVSDEPEMPLPDGTLVAQGPGPHGGFDEESGARIWLVTGPNMAGKSTFLRQNALIAVMAQVGAYVPADRAHIGIIDRLFSRVGASDDLARGRSTFMVEMVETAGILNLATDRSLVILDEIGRGTATFDGLSIAWATVEYLQSVNRCRALFATHYHELTALAQKLPGVNNVTMAVKEWKDDIVFLHKVVLGAASRSYGIQVARLAGLPPDVITRAGDILTLLENQGSAQQHEPLIDELPLFAAARPSSHLPGSLKASTPLTDALGDINPDSLTPREALDVLYRLKELSEA